MSCSQCGVGVWTGHKEQLPVDVELACPPGSDWTDTAEPYCNSCWALESQILNEMTGGLYKAIGKRTDKQKKQSGDSNQKQKGGATNQKQKGGATNQQQKCNKKQKKKTNKKQKKVVKKKAVKLGGVQGLLLPENKVSERWRVGQLVNCRFTDKKYYGAFISTVNNDKTYDVYFYESAECLNNVNERNIKAPLTVKSDRGFKSWTKYVGKSMQGR